MMSTHRLLKTLNAAINVAVEQLEEKTKILGVTLMRSCCHEEIVVRHGRQRLTQLIGKRFLVRAIGGHLVSLVDNHEIPTASEQTFLCVFDTRNPRNGCDNLVFFL